MLCCAVPEYHYENCLEFSGTYGELLSCPEKAQDDNMIVTGMCTSGQAKDCQGESHMVNKAFLM